MRDGNALRVLFLGPTKKDATSGTSLLTGAGLMCHSCASLVDLCREIGAGCGIVVVPEEALLRDRTGALTVQRWSASVA